MYKAVLLSAMDYELPVGASQDVNRLHYRHRHICCVDECTDNSTVSNYSLRIMRLLGQRKGFILQHPYILRGSN